MTAARSETVFTNGGIVVRKIGWLALGLALVLLSMSLSCAPGNERWDQELNPGQKAGFWMGVWHGLIVIITFIVSLFTSEVGLYEVSNTGWPYNLGFIIGLCISIGGGIRGKRHRRTRKFDWDRMGQTIEDRVRKGVQDWLDESKDEERKKEWEEIARKIEEKVRRALKE